jgi:hypothetical protein
MIRRMSVFRLVLATGLCSLVADRASTQVRNAADGPWAGWVQCRLTAQLTIQGDSYVNQQMHTWVLTGFTPTSGTDIKVYSSTWAVTGQGNHQRQYGDGRTLTEQWTTTGQAMPDTIMIRLSADGIVHITSYAQLRSTTAVNGTSVTHSTTAGARDETRPIAYYVDEWPFPVIEDAATKTTIVDRAPGQFPRVWRRDNRPAPCPPAPVRGSSCAVRLRHCCRHPS